MNLELIRESLWKKGTKTPPPKGTDSKVKKTALCADVASKISSRKPELAIQYTRWVVAFAMSVDKGKVTQAAFGKKLMAALSFLQTDKQTALFAIDKSDSSRPPI